MQSRLSDCIRYRMPGTPERTPRTMWCKSRARLRSSGSWTASWFRTRASGRI